MVVVTVIELPVQVLGTVKYKLELLPVAVTVTAPEATDAPPIVTLVVPTR